MGWRMQASSLYLHLLCSFLFKFRILIVFGLSRFCRVFLSVLCSVLCRRNLLRSLLIVAKMRGMGASKTFGRCVGSLLGRGILLVTGIVATLVNVKPVCEGTRLLCYVFRRQINTIRPRCVDLSSTKYVTKFLSGVRVEVLFELTA